MTSKDGGGGARAIVVDGMSISLVAFLRALNRVLSPQGVRLVAFKTKSEAATRAI